MTVATLARSIHLPSADMMSLRYLVLCTWNYDCSGLRYRPAFDRDSRTWRRCKRCFLIMSE